MKALSLVVLALLVGGCVSAGTSAKICADLGVVSRTVGAVSAGAGAALAEWTPKKCVNAAVNGDAGNLTGGVSAGVSNQ